MRPLLLIGLATVLSACSPATDETPTEAAEPGEPTARLEPAAAVGGEFQDLSGEYRVAELDGAQIDRPYAIALSADSSVIWWEPACSGQSVRYEVTGNAFRVVPPLDLGPQDVCDIGLPEKLPKIWGALRAADRIERTDANGIRVHGNARSVTLFSQ